MATTKAKKYLTPKEAADLLNVSTESIRNWTKAGKLSAVTTLGGHRRFLHDEINRFSAKLINRSSKVSVPRILVVDDDEQFVRAIEEYFKIGKNDVVFDKAYDGFEAGHKVNIFKPTIIFLDFLMPNINGVEVCRYLKRNLSTKHIRIVAMTGFKSASIQSEFISEGAEMVLEKPFDFSILDNIAGNKNTSNIDAMLNSI